MGNVNVTDCWEASMEKPKDRMIASLEELQNEIDFLLVSLRKGDIAKEDLLALNKANGLFDLCCKKYFAAERAKLDFVG